MMREFELKNGIRAVYKKNSGTPRIALTLNMSINEEEKLAGTYSLMTRLLMQGTEKYNNEELAKVLDENGIEIIIDMKQDYLRFRLLCLNEDFKKAIELLEDIIKNSTFKEFDKEKTKMKGELVAELDSARLKVSDAFVKTVYEGHYYGHTYTNILKDIDNITQNDVISSYQKITSTSRKVLSVVGSLEESDVINLLDTTFSELDNSNEIKKTITKPVLNTPKKTEVIKEDAQQAQILQGWLVPTFTAEDYPVIVVINTILGSSGLSSRLFRELREKKGLAYTVRSSCEIKELAALFSIYIATEPSNIETCLNGFKEEIDKIKTIPVSEEELHNAKNNIFGKHQFIVETNFQQSTSMAYYGINGLPFNHYENMHERIKNVTPEQIMECANKYFTENSVIAILHP
ncbi:MAG: insulinase family protein [Candidatus Gastranaerophilales bacterium]|nr:insulinase family protein [Candidatus Gastranaerophilales bacterium]